jgi:hypothetical protein
MQAGETWSHTLGKDVDTCLRRVYYRVYGGWGGWSDTADDLTRTIYIAKQSKRLPMYGGTLVHEAAQAILQRYRTGRILASNDKMISRIEERIREDIAYSASGKWKVLRNPKKATLILNEHLAGEDLHIFQIEEAIERYQACLKNFLETYFVEIQEIGPAGIEIIDSLDKIDHRGWTLFMVPDLVHFIGNHAIITDWKTGKMPDVEQLGAYGLYLTKRRDVQRRFLTENISARSVPLLNPENCASVQMTETILQESMAKIDKDIDQMNPLVKPGRAKDTKSFPKTAHRGNCEGCLYKFVCDQED